MKTLRLGELRIKRLGFGAMRITGPDVWGEPADPAAMRDLLKRVESHVMLIDTADSYGPDVSERLIREALAPYSADIVIATKAGYTRSAPGAPWGVDCRPARIRRCCEDSLRRLGLEQIGLYQLHVVDPAVPIEESVGALDALRAEGKIRHIGLCNVNLEELRRAQRVAPVVSVQNRYNIIERQAENVLLACEREDLVFIPYAPLGDGRLTTSAGPLLEIAQTRGMTPGQIALAWLLAHSPVTLPIPGTSSIRHFEQNMEAGTIDLSDDEVSRLDGVSRDIGNG
jgi:pyridoxine 4-dehydrogenase